FERRDPFRGESVRHRREDAIGEPLATVEDLFARQPDLEVDTGVRAAQHEPLDLATAERQCLFLLDESRGRRKSRVAAAMIAMDRADDDVAYRRRRERRDLRDE